MVVTAAVEARPVLGSRAVLRMIEPGNPVVCVHCEELVKFDAKRRQQCRIVCNVYEGGKWSRVEIWHASCYDMAGQPYGEPCDKSRGRR
jgi:hypothetical protein